MRNIMMVSHSAGGGGAERVATLVANSLSENPENNVTFYAIHSDNREYYLSEQVKYHYCEVKGFNKQINQIKRGWKLKKYIKANNIDTVIMFCYLEGLFLAGNKSVKKIYSLRNDPSTFYNKGLMKKLFFKIYKDADKIVFQTPDARDYFPEEIREHGVIIPNPIKQGLPEWDSVCHSNEVIAVCRLSKQKNLNMLLDAFSLVRKERTDHTLAIYGRGPLEDELKEYAKSLGLDDSVAFRGFATNVHEIMQRSAIYVSSSDYEGISNSMLEALAIGVPSVCTDCPVGGARMFIEDGKSGYLAEVGNAKDMAEKMLNLLNDVEKQTLFSKESRKIREELSPEKIYGMWNKVVE